MFLFAKNNILFLESADEPPVVVLPPTGFISETKRRELIDDWIWIWEANQDAEGY